MANEHIDDMTRLERIRGRIDLFHESATLGPKRIILEDMIWMEAILRRLIKAENDQAKFSWVSMIKHKPNGLGDKFFEKGFEWRNEEDDDGRLK